MVKDRCLIYFITIYNLSNKTKSDDFFIGVFEFDD